MAFLGAKVYNLIEFCRRNESDSIVDELEISRLMSRIK